MAKQHKQTKGANQNKSGERSFPRQGSRASNRSRSSSSRTRARAGSRSRSWSRTRGRASSLPRRSRNQATPHNTQPVEYAGPTFYASPAPSSLPMPSNHSAWPDSAGQLADSLARHLVLKDLAETDEEGLTTDAHTPSKSVPEPTSAETSKTPLDFLFKSARANRLGTRLDFSLDSPSNNVSSNSPSAAQTKIPSGANDSIPGGMFHMEIESPAAVQQPPIKKENSMFGPSSARPFNNRTEKYRMADKQAQPGKPIKKENSMFGPSSARPSNNRTEKYRMADKQAQPGKPIKKENSMFGPSSARPSNNRTEEYRMADKQAQPGKAKAKAKPKSKQQSSLASENEAKSEALKQLLFKPSQPPQLVI